VFPIGVMQQAGRFGLVFATSTTDRDLLQAGEAGRVRAFLDRLERIRKDLGCEVLSMAGILPSTSLRLRVGPVAAHAQRSVRTTAQLALRAGLRLADPRGIPAEAPVVVLGGRGGVGTELVAALRHAGREVVVWDRGDDPQPTSVEPSSPLLVIDVSRPGALGGVAARIPAGSVVLSDVYPEPTASTARRLAERGIELHHLAGLPGRIFPVLPGAYRGVIPCCAVLDPLQGTPVVRAIGERTR
jgi:hypothetical protein